MKIRPITDLRNTNLISKEVHDGHEPLIITKNGYGDMVIMSFDSYQKLNKINVEDKNDFSTIQLKQSNNYGYVRIACCSLNTSIGNVERNVEEIKKNINTAIQKNVSIIVFPELSLTAYSCGDLFLQPDLSRRALNGIKTLVSFSEDKEIFFVVGAPLIMDGKLYNCAIAIQKGCILGIIPKTYIPNYTEFYEGRYFSSGNGITKTISINNQKIPFGTNIIFINQGNKDEKIAIEICEDLWVSSSPSSRHVDNGANIILNLSASNAILGKNTIRHELVKTMSLKQNSIYCYCSSSYHESTTDIIFSGHRLIAECGEIIAENENFDSGMLIADVDLDVVNAKRIKARVTGNQNSSDYINVYYTSSRNIPDTIIRSLKKHPFTEQNLDMKKDDYNRIFKMQSLSLANRMFHTHIDHLVIGLSGGSDSTLAFLVCVEALKILGLPSSNLHAITMPCFGTSSRTLDNACNLAKNLNANLEIINIGASVTQHLKDISHSLDDKSVTYENAQARERTQVLMDYANKVNGLVVGTGDLSEIALGWSTYNGDHMSMYSVNCSIPKTLVKDLIAFLSGKYLNCKKILLDIIDTPVSPELLPPKNGEIAQITEDVIGPYELHDFFLYHFVTNSFSSKKIFFLAKQTFKGDYNEETIKKWLNFFIKRFFTQQFKRSCSPDGVKITNASLSPRGDWRMPSDSSYEEYLIRTKSI